MDALDSSRQRWVLALTSAVSFMAALSMPGVFFASRLPVRDQAQVRHV